MTKDDESKVCVTGAAGFIGSWLVRKLLEKGHVVHATLRNEGDHIKVGLLKSFPAAESHLRLFKIDLADPSADYDGAIAGCEFVFHLATPMLHPTENPEDADTTDVAVSAAKRIADSSIRSGTVRRLVYVASVLSASPVLQDGSDGQFGDCIDETCWTPLSAPFSYCQQYERAYLRSKIATEKEILNYNNGSSGLEVVSVASALVGGDTALAYLPVSALVVVSPLTGDVRNLQQLKFMQAVCNCVPLVHVDDLCDALFFCAQDEGLAGGGRVLCSAGYPSVQEIVRMYQDSHGDRVMVMDDDLEPEMTKKVKRGSAKLLELGFKYNYNVKDLLEATVNCARRLTVIPTADDIRRE